LIRRQLIKPQIVKKKMGQGEPPHGKQPALASCQQKQRTKVKARMVKVAPVAKVRARRQMLTAAPLTPAWSVEHWS
jgi:hypothetical protein